MPTKCYQVDELDQAAQALRQGQLVAFPTETVFGLGAIANNEEAVKSVYQAKGRPSDNPLIVHIAKAEDIFRFSGDLSSEVERVARRLVETFWPGPLTIIVPVRKGTFGPTVTGGLQTVGIRMPDHPLTLSLIQKTGFPLVGPSANLSGKPSPTCVQHVLHDFDGKIAGVVDADPTRIGVESTVVDITHPGQVYILRPGAITEKDLQKALPEIEVTDATRVIQSDSLEHPKAPGMKYRHYSPHQEVYALLPEELMKTLHSLTPDEKAKGAVIARDQVLSQCEGFAKTFSLGENVKTATHDLFAGLRAFDDDDQVQILYVEQLPDQAENRAYRNRLSKAASNKEGLPPRS